MLMGWSESSGVLLLRRTSSCASHVHVCVYVRTRRDSRRMASRRSVTPQEQRWGIDR